MKQKENCFLYPVILRKNIIKPEEIKSVRTAALSRAQQKYYQKNKEKLTEKQIVYNKVYNRMIIKCDCGIEITRNAKYYHVKSAKHLSRMKNISEGKLAGSSTSYTRIDCECGGHYIYKDRGQHMRTHKHNKYLLETNMEIKII